VSHSRLPRFCLHLALGCLPWSAPVASLAQTPASHTPQPKDPLASPASTAAQQADLEELEAMEEFEEEVGDRDPTYLRTRAVFSYDDKRLQGAVSLNRIRSKLLYAFGPRQRFGVSALVPVIQTDTPLGSASGSGDTEVQASANVYYRERLRVGAALQSTFQTSSDARLGGAATIIKPSFDVTGIMSSRVSLTGVLYYKQSIHTTRGAPLKQTESDVTLNTRVLDATWFVEWDSYYDVTPGRVAQTMKGGISRHFGGERRPWWCRRTTRPGSTTMDG
jgi:hypothetical protein